ncbi:MAG: preprotein translocase subunit SecG [Deltaproteobacteria bacterium]|nr:preprotein translocase subunit SecG [Deltaproteobacteria bacterium]
MFHFLLVLHAVLCLAMIGLVLLQQGKGAEAGAIMGGSGDSIFGPGGGGSFATRLTTGIAIGFMVTSILLVRAYGSGAYISKKVRDPLQGSIMEGVQASPEVQEQGDEEAAHPVVPSAEPKVEETGDQVEAEKSAPADKEEAPVGSQDSQNSEDSQNKAD